MICSFYYILSDPNRPENLEGFCHRQADLTALGTSHKLSFKPYYSHRVGLSIGYY
jgi:hypothetical protein